MTRGGDRATPAQKAALTAIAVLVAAAAVIDTALEGAQRWAAGSWPAVNPATPLAGLADGTWHWTGTATAVLLAELPALAALAATTAWAVRRARRRGPSLRPYKDAARRMSTSRDRIALHAKAEQTAARLGIAGEPGMRIGRHIPSHQTLYAPWEYLMLVLATAGQKASHGYVDCRPVHRLHTCVTRVSGTRWIRHIRSARACRAVLAD